MEGRHNHSKKEEDDTTKITLDGLRETLVRAIDLRARRMHMSRARLLRALFSHEFMEEEKQIVELDRKNEEL